MAQRRGDSKNIILLTSILLLAVIGSITFYNLVLIAHTPAERVTTEVASWSLESDFFQYKDFFIENVTIAYQAELCTEQTHVNVTLDVTISENFSFSICNVMFDNYVLKNFLRNKSGRVQLEAEFIPEESHNVSISGIPVDEEHSARFCCDNYCNIKTLYSLCE